MFDRNIRKSNDNPGLLDKGIGSGIRLQNWHPQSVSQVSSRQQQELITDPFSKDDQNIFSGGTARPWMQHQKTFSDMSPFEVKAVLGGGGFPAENNIDNVFNVCKPTHQPFSYDNPFISSGAQEPGNPFYVNKTTNFTINHTLQKNTFPGSNSGDGIFEIPGAKRQQFARKASVFDPLTSQVAPNQLRRSKSAPVQQQTQDESQWLFQRSVINPVRRGEPSDIVYSSTENVVNSAEEGVPGSTENKGKKKKRKKKKKKKKKRKKMKKKKNDKA